MCFRVDMAFVVFTIAAKIFPSANEVVRFKTLRPRNRAILPARPSADLYGFCILEEYFHCPRQWRSVGRLCYFVVFSAGDSLF